MALVKAPFSWPKSSLSMVPSGMEPQLMAMYVSATAVVVDDARYDFLAHAAFALDEHGEVCWGDEYGCGESLAESFVAAYDAVAVHQRLHV